MIKIIEPVLYDYKFSLLRNFEIQQLTPYLKTKIKDFNKLLKSTSGSNSWRKIRTILNERVTNGYDDNEIEHKFFESLVYLVPDRCYFINITTDLTADNAFSELCSSSKYSSYKNRKLSQVVRTDEKLVSIRKEGHRIIILFKQGISELGLNKDKCAFYVPCILDFKHNHLEIRLNLHLLRNTRGLQLKDIINELTEFVNKKLPIALSTAKSGEAKIHKGLYKLFLDESNKSLKLIKSSVAKNEKVDSTKVLERKLRENISKYLKEQLHISDPDSFVEKVMTVKYQDTARTMKLKDFIKDGGFIFGFSFIDRKITRSINRNADHKPVYYSKIYWSLRDVVQEYQEITELAIYWRFNKTDFTKKPSSKENGNDTFVEVGFKEIHGMLEVHYYANHSQTNLLTPSIEERRAREEYVVHKIKKFIQ